MSQIYNDLIKGGDFFDIGEVNDFSDGIAALNRCFSFSIASNENLYNVLHNIGAPDDLEKRLDYKFGEFRAVFNLMCRSYKCENGACRISPNIRLKTNIAFLMTMIK